MTRPHDTPTQPAPQFEHVLYGLPGEVPTVPIDEESRAGLLRTGKRKVVAGVIVALLLSGGAGGAYALHERNQQAEALQAEEERFRERLEASSVEVARAAELEEGRSVLEEQLKVAREVHAQSRNFLAIDDEARVSLRTAIADAEGLVDAEGSADVDDVTETTEVLVAATQALEAAVDDEARAVLTEALAEAREVLADSEGRAGDAIRVQLGEAIDQSQELLESSDAAPQALTDAVKQLAEITRSVADAAEVYVPQPPAREEPAVAPPPVQRGTVPQGGERRDTGSSDRPSDPSGDPTQGSSGPTPGSTDAESENETEEPAPGSTPGPTGPGDDPADESVEIPPPTEGSPEGDDGEG